jgi:hypothetical protein
MKPDPKYPRLTPLKSIALLRKVEKARGSGELYEKNNTLETVAEQLEQHIAADLTKRRRR